MTDRLKAWLDEAEWAKKWHTTHRNARFEEAIAALRAVVEWAHTTKHGEAAAQVLRAIEKAVLDEEGA